MWYYVTWMIFSIELSGAVFRGPGTPFQPLPTCSYHVHHHQHIRRRRHAWPWRCTGRSMVLVQSCIILPLCLCCGLRLCQEGPATSIPIGNAKISEPLLCIFVQIMASFMLSRCTWDHSNNTFYNLPWTGVTCVDRYTLIRWCRIIKTWG